MKYLFRWVIVPVLLFFLVSCSMFDEGSDDSDDDDDSRYGTLEISFTSITEIPRSYLGYESGDYYVNIAVFDSDGYGVSGTYDLALSDSYTINDIPEGTDYKVTLDLYAKSDPSIVLLETATVSDVTISGSSSSSANLIGSPDNVKEISFDSSDSVSVSSFSNYIKWFSCNLEEGKKYYLKQQPFDGCEGKLILFNLDWTQMASINVGGSYLYECNKSGNYYIAAVIETGYLGSISLSSSIEELSISTPTEGTLESSKDWYEIFIPAGKKYQINWDDYDDGNCSYTGNIRGTLYFDNFSTTQSISSGSTITASDSERTVYLYIYPGYKSNNTYAYGTYRISIIPDYGSVQISVQ